MKRDVWRFDRPIWDIDRNGVGRAVYRAIGPEQTYSLVAFSHNSPEEMRSDRVIASAWDATFGIFDGNPPRLDLERLQVNVPLREAGRISSRELSVSRANHSVRRFDLVVESLAQGHQPGPVEVEAVGYLMWTTAIYGSGKFDAAARDDLMSRAELSAPLQGEVLSVWLI